MVTIRIRGGPKEATAQAEVIEVEGSTIDEALRSLVAAHPDLNVRSFGNSKSLHPQLMVYLRDVAVARDEWASTVVTTEDEITVRVAISRGAYDVRMRGFRERATVEAARAAALRGVVPLPIEEVPIADCAGRVLAKDVESEVDVPPFRRATMDGFAVYAEDTYGASAYDPLLLDLVGPSMPGRGEGDPVSPGSAGRIMTGAPIPEGADAVLRAEDALERDGRLEVTAPVAMAKNIGRIGEDVEAGTTILSKGRRLLPHDVGLLASIGGDPVQVYRRPVVHIIVSGNELLAPGDKPDGYKIVDSNSPMLAALVLRDGGVPQVARLLDDEDMMRQALARSDVDVIVTAGAASVGIEDRIPMLVDELGELTIHGVAMRPSSPAGVGRINGIPVLLLPGNPVSCLAAYDFFAGPVIRVMGGRPGEWPYRSVNLPLRKRLVSQIGRTDYARVIVTDGAIEPVAISGASVLSSVTRASGFVVVPAGLEGYGEGVNVRVHLYESVGGA